MAGSGETTIDTLIAGNGEQAATPAEADVADGQQAAPEEGTDGKLEKRIEDSRRYLEETQREITKARMELAEYKGAVEALKTSQQAQAEPDDETPDYLHETDWHQKYNTVAETNPAEAISDVIKQERSQVVGLVRPIGEELKALKAEIASLKAELSPERQELRPVLAELSQKAWFKALPPDAQTQAAKEWAASRGDAPPKPPATSPGGTGRGAAPSKAKGPSEAEKMASTIFGQYRKTGKQNNTIQPVIM